MKKVLILETAVSYRGKRNGGSYLQARYYDTLLKEKGYQTNLYCAKKEDSKLLTALKIIREIRKTDYVIGFGTSMLCFSLQWLSLVMRKKGVFCLDTIIVPMSIIQDHLKKQVFSLGFFYRNLQSFLLKKTVMRLFPPKLALLNIASCQFVQKNLPNFLFRSSEYPTKEYLFPRVKLKRRSIILNDQGKTVLFYGSLYRGRGLIDLLRACRILWKKGMDIKLEILGWPINPLTKKTLLKEIKKGERKRILLKEKVRNVNDYLKNASVVVLPFRYPCSFQTPLTLLEPMAMGIPVITTAVGSHGEWIKDEETGLFCEKENPVDIADKIQKVLTNNDLANQLTDNAYHFLQNKYKQEDLLLKILRDTSDGGPE